MVVPDRVETRIARLTAWTTSLEFTATHGSGGSVQVAPMVQKPRPAKPPLDCRSAGLATPVGR